MEGINLVFPFELNFELGRRLDFIILGEIIESLIELLSILYWAPCVGK